MADKQGSKPTISLRVAAEKLLVFIMFLQVALPHLRALIETMRDQAWVVTPPVVLNVHPTEVKDVA